MLNIYYKTKLGVFIALYTSYFVVISLPISLLARLSFLIFFLISNFYLIDKIHELIFRNLKHYVDCSTLFISSKKNIRKVHNIDSNISDSDMIKISLAGGSYNKLTDKITINSTTEEITEEEIVKILSHESLHKILFHRVSSEASDRLDRYLQTFGRYGVDKVGKGGI